MVDQRILQSHWLGYITGHIQPKKIVTGATFVFSPTLWKKNQDINGFFLDTLTIKESCNLIGQEVRLATSSQKWLS